MRKEFLFQRLVMKIWLKLRGKEDNDFREEGENISKSWNSLIDHYEDLVNDSKDLLTAQYKVLETHINKSDLPSMEEFITIYGKILTNSFSLRSDRYAKYFNFLPSLISSSQYCNLFLFTFF